MLSNPDSPGPTLTGDRLPLPKCSYINTDFPGDDLILEGYTEPGINAGSARACKARCRLDDACSFWTYKEGFSRDTLTLDCFLKEGTPGKYPGHVASRLYHRLYRSASAKRSCAQAGLCVGHTG